MVWGILLNDCTLQGVHFTPGLRKSPILSPGLISWISKTYLIRRDVSEHSNWSAPSHGRRQTISSLIAHPVSYEEDAWMPRGFLSPGLLMWIYQDSKWEISAVQVNRTGRARRKREGGRIIKGEESVEEEESRSDHRVGIAHCKSLHLNSCPQVMWHNSFKYHMRY